MTRYSPCCFQRRYSATLIPRDSWFWRSYSHTCQSSHLSYLCVDFFTAWFYVHWHCTIINQLGPCMITSICIRQLRMYQVITWWCVFLPETPFRTLAKTCYHKYQRNFSRSQSYFRCHRNHRTKTKGTLQ